MPVQETLLGLYVQMKNKQKIFQLKILNGQKAKKVTEGYILNFTSTSQTGFTLMSPVTVDGKTAYVYYDFVREIKRKANEFFMIDFNRRNIIKFDKLIN
ncbi:MAG: hypothetical protein PW786_06700 [Arachidicoccus sp.]|nr:hypothetical protein [Arachidicoccus sp.]